MKYFFSGIGGIGMSSLALYSYYSGNEVYGTNNEINERVEYLENKGIKINIGHTNVLPNVDVVIRSTAIKDDNPEIIEANKRGIPVLYRMEYLNNILKNNWSIGITGTDGKTSTTAMVSQIFKYAKKDPTVFLGGIHNFLEDGNFRIGSGQIIAEVDESDGYIKKSQSDVVIINNLRPDHLEHYNNDFQNLENSLKQYAKRTRDILFLNGDDPILSTWNLNVPQLLFFGQNNNCDYIMKNRKTMGRYQEFEVYYKDKFIGKITLPIPGEHYAYDALAATALAIEYGIDFNTIHEALFTYKTVNRRFNILYSNSSIFVIDDYAHTPDEISMTIDAAKEYFPNKRIITIFQPHRYTRLYRHMKGFINALEKSDEVLVYRIYSAFEKPIEGVDESKITNLLDINSKYFDDSKKLINHLIDYNNSVLLFVGAGDITKVANKVGRIFKNKNH
ncbi:UDP-N-acetylmuramate--L-alanine ligase [Tepiditoga spiralis]|uniref:UDP-N-acetylmuramate--L-alanine ligase n=1 Tax=Tepiditoga spiralis TaxID=2108365 RepID=A0A7G1G335_9BACT|nr:UDP-N-acetylmuramate--L-alanine ligase [Tepiditoga spiralis]BBE30375.1 UDP-N-acetylmuramate--L-alanine ligase [Tepiditoga spiralis]